LNPPTAMLLDFRNGTTAFGREPAARRI
jgi:hypothetical protein